MNRLLVAVAVNVLLSVPSVAQTVQGQVGAGVNVNQAQIDAGNLQRLVCRTNPRNRNCSGGPRPEQRQPGQRRTGGIGGGPRP